MGIYGDLEAQNVSSDAYIFCGDIETTTSSFYSIAILSLRHLFLFLVLHLEKQNIA